MAFSCEFTNITDTTAIFEANFTGGDASYTKWRMVKLTISDPKATTIFNESIIISDTQGTGSSHFTSLIQGLKAETEYSYKAELGYGSDTTDSSKITWLGYLDEEGSVSKYTASGSFETESDGSTGYFVASEMETEKYAIIFYAEFTYDATIAPHVTEANKLTIVYSTDPNIQIDTHTLRFDSTEHQSTGENEGFYKWDDIRIDGLKAGKTYYWKAYPGPQSEAGSVTGYVKGNSTTLPPEPNALSLRIRPISETKAILSATYYDAETNDLEDFKTLHYKFSTNGGSTWGSYQTCIGTVDDEHHFILYEKKLEGMSSDTTYTYRAYVGSEDPWEE